jgi:hypothetical protein
MALFCVFVSTVYVTTNSHKSNGRKCFKSRSYLSTRARKVCACCAQATFQRFNNMHGMKIVLTKTQPAGLKQAYHAYLPPLVLFCYA